MSHVILFTQDYLAGCRLEFIYFVYIIVGRVAPDNATVIKVNFYICVIEQMSVLQRKI